MKFYLKYVNPVVALFVLLLCVWAASTIDNGKINFYGTFIGGFGTYFFAKGLFCSASLFIAGRSLLARIDIERSSSTEYSKKEIALVGLIVLVFAGVCLGVYGKQYLFEKSLPENNITTTVSPKGVSVSELSKIKAAQYLTLSGQLKNSSTTKWHSIGVEAEIFIGGVYSGKLTSMDTGVNAKETRNILLKSSELLTKEISDSVTYKVNIAGARLP